MHIHRFGHIASVMSSLCLLGCGTNPLPLEFDAGSSLIMMEEVDAGQPVTGIPVLGNGTHLLSGVVYVAAAGPSDGLKKPRDVAVNPASPTTDLWVVNWADHSIVTVKKFGTPEQVSKKHQGPGSNHFLMQPSALAFGDTNRLATAHEVDVPTQPGTPAHFMGPSLWPTDETFEGGHASHQDMLHNSPNAVGIAWDKANVYWVFDGYHNAITRYDFVKDHGPGGEDHSDGIIIRTVEGQVSYVKNIASGLDMDHATGRLYIADTGNSRIAVLDTANINLNEGTSFGPNFDGAVQKRMTGMNLTTLADGSTTPLRKPSGLALNDGLVYVSDNETSQILAFDFTGKLVDWLDLSPLVRTGGLMGIDFDAQGNLYAVDNLENWVMKISPKP